MANEVPKRNNAILNTVWPSVSLHAVVRKGLNLTINNKQAHTRKLKSICGKSCGANVDIPKTIKT